MSCDWGFAADSMALAGKRDRREVVGAPEPPPHPTFAPCLAAPERTSEGQIGRQKGRAGYGVFLPAACLPLANEHVEVDGPAEGHPLVSRCGPAALAPARTPALRGATRIRAGPQHGPMSDHPTRGLAGAPTFASRRRRPTTTARPPTIARPGRPAPVAPSFS